ncbi:MAG: hypothetical protein RSD71_00800 [Flavobacterium sp.]
MELVKKIQIPVIADSVLSPDVYYSDELTSIYFQTEDDKFGRITFYNLDAIKICRGELMPFEYDWNQHERGDWVYKIENSKWLLERYNYENKNYRTSYEFGGNVDDMTTDFNHYLFSFHDQFIEVIAKGFWFEKDPASLFKKSLQSNHPFLNLPEIDVNRFSAYNLTCQVRKNQKTTEELIADAQYCPQKLFQFALEIGNTASIDHSLNLQYRNGKLISVLRGYFGKQIVEFEGIASFDDVKPYIEKYIEEVSIRRKEMGK